jgi:D-sedoheptulose 7-phosphate isomerase
VALVIDSQALEPSTMIDARTASDVPAAADVDPSSRLAPALKAHIAEARRALAWLDGEVETLVRWAGRLAEVLTAGGRVLVAGNGGSAALTQHLTSELVGRYHHERPPFSAIALTADTSALTALGNDYGFDEAFARQVLAHGRPGDVFVGLSSSGRSPNLLRAAEAARSRGMHCWAMTGPAPNPLAELGDEVLAVPAQLTATVQEVQQVGVHLLCRAFDHCVASSATPPTLSWMSPWPATRS